MELDRQARRRARLARDVRFDGKFFVGVLSTKIYCRPSCPVPIVGEKNVRYFPSAAAAEEAGFRPCLRCRPECSPGSPAWLGTPALVARGLRVIAESGLGDGGVEELAARLGVGGRHLRRLFLRHLGASPSTVARTRRLHFAKKLIDETALPMNQVALASGFGCVRRFNAAISRTYHRTPTQVRKLAGSNKLQPQNEYFFQLRFRPPYHWKGMLAFLAARAIPGIEAVDQATYGRSFSMNGHAGYFEVAFDEREPALLTRIAFADPLDLFTIVERIRRMFDVDADWQAIAETLKADPLLASLVDAHPGLRLPGAWNGFELAVRAVLGQQISVKGANTLAGRLVAAFGQPFPSGNGLARLFPRAEVLADADLAGIGLTKARANTIRSLARAVCSGGICLDRLVDTVSFRACLREVPGIGKWTAEYVAMRGLMEPDAFPSGDVALLRALGLTTLQALEARAEAWRPWRAYGAIYLWSISARPPKPERGNGKVRESSAGAATTSRFTTFTRGRRSRLGRCWEGRRSKTAAGRSPLRRSAVSSRFSEDIVAGQGMDRREVLRALAMAATASRFPGFSRWAFACEDHVNGGAPAPRSVNYTPQFFSLREYATLERLTDMIIPADGTPGAKEAGVAEFIDFMVAHDESVQYPFRLGLTWLDAESERLDGKRFLDLAPEKQIEMLEHLAYHDHYREGEGDGRAFFKLVRRYTVMGYYTSRIGLHGLNYPGLKLYAESPGCPHHGDPAHRHLPSPKF
jgi:AraC family transcriptional regulator, regulatory protein of adaptative response / DNA-3-methyladenine glycosylase II